MNTLELIEPWKNLVETRSEEKERKNKSDEKNLNVSYNVVERTHSI